MVSISFDVGLVVITDKQRGELTDVLGRAIAASGGAYPAALRLPTETERCRASCGGKETTEGQLPRPHGMVSGGFFSL
jgi:hypothetical protein